MLIRAVLGLGFFLMLALPADAEPLRVAEVALPAVYCVFHPACRINMDDLLTDFDVPGVEGRPVLQTRLFTGVVGAAAAGRHGFLYRVDLSYAVRRAVGPCVAALKLDFGPILPFNYADDMPSDIFVITKMSLGNIALSGADLTDTNLTLTFAKPVCPGMRDGAGDSSYYIGVTGAGNPRPVDAQLVMTQGPPLTVSARVPYR